MRQLGTESVVLHLQASQLGRQSFGIRRAQDIFFVGHDNQSCVIDCANKCAIAARHFLGWPDEKIVAPPPTDLITRRG
jgi:hypothetical protein